MDLFLRKFDEPIGEKSDSPYALHKQTKNQILIDHYQLWENDWVLLEQIEKNHGKKSDFFLLLIVVNGYSLHFQKKKSE